MTAARELRKAPAPTTGRKRITSNSETSSEDQGAGPEALKASYAPKQTWNLKKCLL